MFVSKKLIYLQVHKTGSTHITKVMRTYCGGRADAKHDQLRDPSVIGRRMVVSSVRNPWDWYVSLWAFGCEGSGGLRKYFDHVPLSEIRHAWRNRNHAVTLASMMRAVTRLGRRPDWKALYSDPLNEANFRAWLTLMLGGEGQFLAKEGYSASPVKAAAGFMSYRFLSLATAYGPWMERGRFITDPAELAEFAEANMVARRIIRMESLNDDLLAVLNDAGHRVTREELETIGKTNTSTHRKYADYFDAETYDLVARRDRVIIDRFGYGGF